MDIVRFFRDGAYEALGSLMSYLSVSDLKAFSLCSREARHLTMPYLFDGTDRLYLSSNKVDLDVFKAVTNNSFLCQRVQRIVFDDSTYDERSESDDYWLDSTESIHPSNFRTGKNRELFRNELSPTTEKGRFWRSFVADHLYIKSQNLDIQALTETLPKLYNLTSITLTALTFTPDILSHARLDLASNYISPAIRLMQRHGLSDVPSWKNCLCPTPRWLPEWLLTRKTVSPINLRSSLEKFGTFRSLQGICRALRRAPQCHLKHFAIELDGSFDRSAVRGYPHHFFSVWTTELNILEHAFMSLHTLSLAIDIDPYDDHLGTDDHLGLETNLWNNLYRLLHAASSLKKTYLDLGGADPSLLLTGRDSHNGFELVLNKGISISSNSVTKHLESIHFAYNTLRLSSLLQLLSLTTTVVRSLQIEECRMISGTWKNLLDTLRHNNDFGLLREAGRFMLAVNHVSDNVNGVYYIPAIQDDIMSRAEQVACVCTSYIRGIVDVFPMRIDPSRTLPRYNFDD